MNSTELDDCRGDLEGEFPNFSSVVVYSHEVKGCCCNAAVGIQKGAQTAGGILSPLLLLV